MESVNDVVDEPVVLSEMPIADKVSRYLQARYYSVQLAALQKAAAAIGCEFAQRSTADYMPPEVEEHLALALVLARESHLRPRCTAAEHHKAVLAQVEDGYASVLFAEVVAALDALGLRFRLHPQGIDWNALMEQQRLWQAARKDLHD